MISRLPLFPPDSRVNDRGNLVIGGCDTVDLAAEYGTPLYLFDEASLRARCREFKEEFGRRYSNTAIVYSCKAFINKALTALFHEEGLGLEVVSGGELGIVTSAGFPPNRIYFTGNNKSPEELRQALEVGIGRIIVDNLDEMRLLSAIADEVGISQDILLRLTPGVDPHTHRYISTGNIDSKFGIPLALGEEAIVEAMSAPNLNLLGLHFHIGSQIFEVEPYSESVRKILGLAAEMRHEHGFSSASWTLAVASACSIPWTPRYHRFQPSPR